MKAIWHGVTIAESDTTIELEGNHYFPLESVDPTYLTESSLTSRCPWKGIAHYYTLTVDGTSNIDAAWYYPEPLDGAKHIQDHIAFWRGVEVTE